MRPQNESGIANSESNKGRLKQAPESDISKNMYLMEYLTCLNVMRGDRNTQQGLWQLGTNFGKLYLKNLNK